MGDAGHGALPRVQPALAALRRAFFTPANTASRRFGDGLNFTVAPALT